MRTAEQMRRTARFHLAFLMASAVAGELVSAAAVRWLLPHSLWAEALLDVGILCAVLLPTSLLVVVRPMVGHIVEREQAERALRESEARFRAVVDTIPAAIRIYDGERMVFANGANSILSGYSTEEVLAPGFLERAVHPDELLGLAVRQAWHSHNETVTQHFDNRIVRKDGEMRWITNVVVPITFDGRAATLSASTDITDRKRAEEALHQSESGLREAQRLAQIGSWQWDVATDAVTWSDTLYSINGRDPTLPPPHFAELSSHYKPESWSRLSAAVAKTLESGQPYELELEMTRPDGAERQILARGGADHDASGSVVKLFGIVQDITERKQAEAERDHLEAQLRQAQKLEAVGQLAAGVAHDFNNKLAVILGSADMALAELDPANQVSSDIQEIRTAAWRSADLTRQLLAFARLQPIAPRQLDLNETVESMLSMLRRLTGEGVHLEWKPASQPCCVRADPGQVDQVLVNLVVNARDAVLGSGTVTIATSGVGLDSAFSANRVGAKPGRYVVIKVADDGHGMDEATKGRIFEPFFTTKPQGQGTGLGLATVYGIAQQNHGFVDVQSELGKGTTIEFYLPEETGQAVPEGSQPHMISRVPESTVLLVEDDQPLLKLTTRMLRQMGLTVLSAEGPAEAVELASKYPGEIALLMTDVVMPVMNGAELSRRLNETRPQLRCLFVSGYPAHVLAENGVLDEGVDLLVKPYSQESLALKLREVLARA